jgi:hypothetical protein
MRLDAPTLLWLVLASERGRQRYGGRVPAWFSERMTQLNTIISASSSTAEANLILQSRLPTVQFRRIRAEKGDSSLEALAMLVLSNQL